MKLLITLLLGMVYGTTLTAEERHPNIILVLADDLGAQELSCYGSERHKTPNLDRMADEGVRFETFFSHPLCTPARLSLMTGQYGFRNGYLGMHDAAFLPPESSPQRDIAQHFTHAKLLQGAGYKTAHVGKWQLSGRLPSLVYEAGFDEYRMWAYDENLPPDIRHRGQDGQVGIRQARGGDTRYWWPCLMENGAYVPTEVSDFGPDLFHDFVVDFARRHKDQPFFISYNSVLTHGPRVPTPDPNQPGERWPAGLKSNLEYLDHLMGRLLAALETEGLAQNTIVLFLGDNGTGGEGKGEVRERGARVPCIVRGPGVTPGIVSRALADVTDILPTLAEWAGVTLPNDRVFDGQSLVPLLRGDRQTHREWIYSHLDDGRILRDSRWLLEIDPSVEGKLREQFFDCGECRNGTEYKDVTASRDPEVLSARARFAKILASIPEPKPNRGMVPQRRGADGRLDKAKTAGRSAAATDQLPKAADAPAKPKQPRTILFDKRDMDGDEQLSWEEYHEGSGRNAAESRKLFEKWDLNKDGSLSRDEFVSMGVKAK